MYNWLNKTKNWLNNEKVDRITDVIISNTTDRKGHMYNWLIETNNWLNNWSNMEWN